MSDVQKDTITPQMAEVNNQPDSESTIEFAGEPVEVADKPYRVIKHFVQTDEERGEGDRVVL